jgi:hypothetical protein
LAEFRQQNSNQIKSTNNAILKLKKALKMNVLENSMTPSEFRRIGRHMIDYVS